MVIIWGTQVFSVYPLLRKIKGENEPLSSGMTVSLSFMNKCVVHKIDAKILDIR